MLPHTLPQKNAFIIAKMPSLEDDDICTWSVEHSKQHSLLAIPQAYL